MTVGGWIQGAKLRKNAVKMIGSNSTTEAISPRKAKEANRGVEKRLTRLKEMYGEENIISAVITMNRDNAHLRCDFCAVDQAKSIGSVIGDKKKMRRT